MCGVLVVFVVVLQLFVVAGLSSLPVAVFVGDAGGSSNKVTKVWLQRSVEKGDKYVRAQAGQGTA